MSGLTQENFRGKKQTGAGCANKPHSEHHEHTYNCNGKNCDINGNIRNTNLFDNLGSLTPRMMLLLKASIPVWWDLG